MSTGTEKLKTDLHEVMGEARSSASHAVQATMEKIGCTKSNLQQRCHSAEDAIHHMAISHPGRSLAAAALAGIAIGYLMGSRRPA
ncbi:hypothetical protein FNU76_14935 [Chitinimonas arctica]|uniref:DUF883 domain-containing protein n=1 Tax=Chitinimonas arctica TaxID=2594795 RepID=A0A516SHA4_9NEIS|nr:hypothetical protein [Chitinimonas arctica]QDQ27544.1 hypothetical protein FNU76_14935 [Chitinimonas arctica]